ncbi:hypothetical protein ACIQUY_31900 [Streptomyces sp. NPDC090231]|uniref:hypothetical protein n=1 Tax=unclassified Streptomyces TaxID=2593676 RepID=UPI00381C3801
MSRKKPDTEEPEETPEGSPAAGACVLVVLGGGALAVIYAVSPDAAIFTIWAAGMVAMWRVARSVRRAPSPAPPPVTEGAADEKPQFTIVEDREGHCTVQWTEGA